MNALLPSIGLACTGVSSSTPPTTPTDTDASTPTDTSDTDLPTPADTADPCAPTPLEAIGYTAVFANLDTVEAAAATECISSWRCTTTPQRRGFSRQVSESEAGAFFDDDAGLVATWASDDGADVCVVTWTGIVVDDCPPADVMQSTGCVANANLGVTPELQTSPPTGPATPDELRADHPCHGEATCTVDGASRRTLSTPGIEFPNVYVFDGSSLVASGNALVWHGSEVTAPCLDAPRTPSAACGLAE